MRHKDATRPVCTSRNPASEGRRRRGRGRLIATLVLVAVVAGAVGYLVGRQRHSTTNASPTSGSKGTSSNTSATAAPATGTVYLESNIAQPNANTIIAYTYREGGNLRPLQVAEYRTGGAGSADLTDSGVLDADQHIIVSRQQAAFRRQSGVRFHRGVGADPGRPRPQPHWPRGGRPPLKYEVSDKSRQP